MDAKQHRSPVCTTETIWAIAFVVVGASIPLTLLASAAFPVLLAWALHLVASTLFLKKGLTNPPIVGVLYWGVSNVVLLGVAIWALAKVPEGLLFL